MTAIAFAATNLADLKAEYRRLAFQHHPDAGGNVGMMAAVNAAFDDAFARLSATSPAASGQETGRDFRAGFYTRNGWAGDRYEIGRSTKEVAVLVRAFLKDEFSDCRFSVRVEHGTRICIDLMEAPRDAYREGADREREIQNLRDSGGFRDWDGTFRPNPAADWTVAMARKIRAFVDQYRHDDSDAMVDYFDFNFIYTVGVGRWNKPFRVVARKPRAPRKTAAPAVADAPVAD